MVIDRQIFFERIKKNYTSDGRSYPALFKSMTQSQVDGLNALLQAFENERVSDERWIAYMLATAYHETAYTMQPIEEYGKGKGRAYGKPDPKTGKTYYGRGYVQLTWVYNYEKAQSELKEPLVMRPEMALRPDIAAAIMIHGMREGWFTGRKLADYIGKQTDYVGARKIINGTDKDRQIAAYAEGFDQAITPAKAPPAEKPKPPQVVASAPVPEKQSLWARFFGAIIG
jgi:hypothetical protein